MEEGDELLVGVLLRLPSLSSAESFSLPATVVWVSRRRPSSHPSTPPPQASEVKAVVKEPRVPKRG